MNQTREPRPTRRCRSPGRVGDPTSAGRRAVRGELPADLPVLGRRRRLGPGESRARLPNSVFRARSAVHTEESPGALYPAGSRSPGSSRGRLGELRPSVGVLDPRTTNVWRPFRAVDGTVIDAHTDPTFNPTDRRRQLLAEPVLRHRHHQRDRRRRHPVRTARVPNCSRCSPVSSRRDSDAASGCCAVPVVEPTDPKVLDRRRASRRTGSRRTSGRRSRSIADQVGVATSPLAPTAWENRIAIPLEFYPVDSPCRPRCRRTSDLAGTNSPSRRSRAGSPPCAVSELPPFSYAPVGDQNARRQLTSPAVGSPGLVVVNRPIPPRRSDPAIPMRVRTARRCPVW